MKSRDIQRTKFAQGFECTKAARLFSSSETSRSAVLSHRSGCLLRTVEGSWLSLQKSTGMLETQLFVQWFKGGWVGREASTSLRYRRYAKPW